MTKEDLEEELEAIESIYPGAVVPTGSFYWLEVPDRYISIQLSLPSSYPTDPPNIMSVQSGPEKSAIEDILHSIFIPDQVCLFDFIESIRDTFEQEEDDPAVADGDQGPDTSTVESLSKEDLTKEIFSHWTSGSTLVDRKSVFIGFATEAHSLDQVNDMLSLLKKDKHISKATHNMVAYRIKGDNGVVISDNDDDGETAAGGRLQHLLEVLYLSNASCYWLHG